VARVAALIPDLMFGSRVQGMLQQAGHDVELVTAGLDGWDGAAAVDVLVVDLVSADAAGIALLQRVRPGAEPPALAVYSHVDPDTRRRAIDAGFDLVVPRSRMVREGAHLVAQLAGA
jgi:DNA-binding response OmpR family regulator